MGLRSNLQLFSFFSLLFFSLSLGGFKGIVLCYGADGHIHTEITFNGVDCGHFPKMVEKTKGYKYLSAPCPPPHADHCISCTDIPLSHDCSLKQFDHTNTLRAASKLKRSVSLPLTGPALALLATTSGTSPGTDQSSETLTLNRIHTTILIL